MLHFMHFSVVTHNVLLPFILLVSFYGYIVMANGRKIVPEEKASLKKKHREVPLGPLAVGTDRPEQKQLEKRGKSMRFHSLCIGQIILTYLAKVFGKLLLKSVQHFIRDEMCKLLFLYIFPMIPSSSDTSI